MLLGFFFSNLDTQCVQIIKKCYQIVSYVRERPDLSTQSVQRSSEVHSVSVYFSAVRKTGGKKGKTKNIHPAGV